jgi:tetratricopeptide (TPR) repeat protein
MRALRLRTASTDKYVLDGFCASAHESANDVQNHLAVGCRYIRLAIGKILVQQSKLWDALVEYEKAHGCLVKCFQKTHLQAIACLAGLAELQIRLGRSQQVPATSQKGIHQFVKVVKYINAWRAEVKRAEEETGEADLGEVYICKWSKLKTAVDASELRMGSLLSLANAYLRVSRFQLALPLLEELRGLEEQMAAAGQKRPKLAEVLDKIGFVLLKLQRPAEAGPVCVAALAENEELHGKSDLSLVHTLNMLGTVHDQLRQPRKAQAQYSRALLIVEAYVRRQRALAADAGSDEDIIQPDVVDTTLLNMAHSLETEGVYFEALQFYRYLLDIKQRRFRRTGSSSSCRIPVPQPGANLRPAIGDKGIADTVYSIALCILQLKRAKFGAYNKAQLKDKEAIACLDRAVQIYTAVLGPDHRGTREALIMLRNAKEGMFDEASESEEQEWT